MSDENNEPSINNSENRSIQAQEYFTRLQQLQWTNQKKQQTST
jgi:hypothetical protein